MQRKEMTTLWRSEECVYCLREDRWRRKGRVGNVTTLNLQNYHTISVCNIYSGAVKHYLSPCSGVWYQNRSVICAGIKAAAAEARWSRVMEEGRSTVLLWTKREGRCLSECHIEAFVGLWACSSCCSRMRLRPKLQPPHRRKFHMLDLKSCVMYNNNYISTFSLQHSTVLILSVLGQGFWMCSLPFC